MLQLCVCHSLPKRLVVILPGTEHVLYAQEAEICSVGERQDTFVEVKYVKELTRASALTFKPWMPGRRRIALKFKCISSEKTLLGRLLSNYVMFSARTVEGVPSVLPTKLLTC